ncbi:hypothetical protein KKE06_03170 [Candidatus Micrarchaeota archaeon]|nr:hypothetical protein [Candidatus Micrarchaeota archaeon]MBU1930942.1 hypothetical protein [Candidatus Micrarchaeota archaeon]
MGLYETWQFDSDLFKKGGIVIVGLIVVIAVIWVLAGAFQPAPLQVQLSGFINLATNPDGFPIQPNSELTITVTNPNPEPAHNVSVFVTPQDDRALIVFPDSMHIEILDKSRSFVVSIRPNPNERVLSGTYLLTVQTMIGSETYSQQVELEVKNPSA